MYTHLRILSESTDVSTEMENQGSGTRVPAHSVGKAVVLRKFRVAKDCLGSDLDLSREKTAEIGYGDIHLEISGHWPATLYPEIYGIPESLLTFLSQTISIANEKAKLEVMAVNDGSISSALSRHIRTLEQNIWQWSLEKNELPIGPTRPNNLIDADAALISQPHARSVALALHQALIIYFYRRVYNMSAMVVQDSVRKTVEFLQPCLADDADTHNFATTIAWCSFVAACEATSASLQQDSIKCLEAVAERAGMFGADNPCEVVKSVWQQRAESGGWALSWPDVLNQRIG